MTIVARQVLSSNVTSVEPNALVRDTLRGKSFDAARQAAVVEGGKCIGLWTRATGEAADANATNKALVQDQVLVIVDPETPLKELARLFEKHDVPGLIVLSDGEFIGVVTQLSLLSSAVESELGAESRSQSLLEASPVCTKLVDRESRLTYMSGAGQRRLGISNVEEFYGQSFPSQQLYATPWRRLLVQLVEQALKGKVQNMEVPAFAVDGSQVWYDTTLSPICDADGVVQHIIVTSVDITARKDAEKEARENRDYRVQASHLGTVMEMATGIAQPLTAIASYGHVAAQLINSSDSKGALNALASLDQQIHRAGETLRELRIFSQETLQSHTS